MTYLTNRQITSNKFGESFNTWNFTNGKLLSSHRRILIYSCRCYMSTIDYLLSVYNGIVIDVRFDMIDYKDNEGNIIRDSKVERDAVLEKYGNRINEVTELVDFYYDLIVMNPPYSTYINNDGKKVVNPSQLMVEEATKYLEIKNGQLVLLCRAQDFGMGATCGKRTRNSLDFTSLHYSSNNFNFKEVRASIIGAIGQYKCGQLSEVFFDNKLISKSINQNMLPRLIKKSSSTFESINLLLKIFNYSYVKKFGTGQEGLALWNGQWYERGALQLKLISSENKPKTSWTLPGKISERIFFDKFLSSKLFLVLSDLESKDIKSPMPPNCSHFVKGCIPDNWRDLNTDEKIYTHFNLTQEEIDFVENYQVQTYEKI